MEGKLKESWRKTKGKLKENSRKAEWAKTLIRSHLLVKLSKKAYKFALIRETEQKRWYVHTFDCSMREIINAFTLLSPRLHTSVSLSNRFRKPRFLFKLFPPPSQRPKPSKTLRHSIFSYADLSKYESTADCPDHPGGGGGRPLKTTCKRNNKKTDS